MTTANRKLRVFMVLLGATALGACATPLTSTVDTAQDAEFDQLHTYAWLGDSGTFTSDVSAPDVVNPLNAQRIRSSVEDELNSKGYRKVPIDEADFVVSFTLGARERYRVQRYYDDLGYRYHGYHGGFSRFSRFNRFGTRFGPRLGANVVNVRRFTEGTLVVDIFENRENQAIWHGSAQRRLSGDNATQHLIDDAVMTLLSEFPDRDAMADLSMTSAGNVGVKATSAG